MTAAAANRSYRALVGSIVLLSGVTVGFGRSPEPSAPVAAASGRFERDLGEGLTYYRVRTVPSDLPATDPGHKQPCVLDLRFARGDAAAATVLGGWLKVHAANRAPAFVLVNGATAAPLLTELSHRDAIPGLLIIGVAAQRFEPDFIVNESPRDERRAYDALERGSSVAAVITDNPDKVRNDEASLARERTPDASSDETTDEPDTGTAKPKPVEPPIDAALQRAIQLHRALRAMKRL